MCVVKTLKLPKQTHIATVLPTLKHKKIKEMEQICYNYISPKKVEIGLIKKLFMPQLQQAD